MNPDTKETPWWQRPPLTVSQAQKARVCRFCQEDDHARGPDNPFLLHYGSEYAHKKCVEKANELGNRLPLPKETPWEKAADEIHGGESHDAIRHDLGAVIERACIEHAAELRAENEALKARLLVSVPTAWEVQIAALRTQLAERDQRLALYDSATEIITTPAGKVWIAAEKHEAVLDQRKRTIATLRTALENIVENCNPSDKGWHGLADALNHIKPTAADALAAAKPTP